MNEYLSALLQKDYGLFQREKDVLLALLVLLSEMGQDRTTATYTQIGQRAGGMRSDHVSKALARLLERNILRRIEHPDGSKALQINHPHQWVSTPHDGASLPHGGALMAMDSTPHGGVFTPHGGLPHGGVFTPHGGVSTPHGGGSVAAGPERPQSPVNPNLPASRNPVNSRSPHARARTRAHEERDHERSRDHGHDLSHGEIMGETSHAAAVFSHNESCVSESASSPPGAPKSGGGRVLNGLLPPNFEEAFPDEINWVLDGLRVKTMRQFELPVFAKALRDFRLWVGYKAEQRLLAYSSAKKSERHNEFQYALHVLKNNSFSSQEAAKNGSVKPQSGPKHDWDAIARERQG